MMDLLRQLITLDKLMKSLDNTRNIENAMPKCHSIDILGKMSYFYPIEIIQLLFIKNLAQDMQYIRTITNNKG